jgi:hypothetical protein
MMCRARGHTGSLPLATRAALLIRAGRPYLGSMKKPRPPQKKATADKLRSWRVSVLRARMQYRGDVQAPDQRSAEAEAVRQFKLSDEERKRLVLQERDSAP